MVKEGTLTEGLANSLFDTLATESDRVNLERASHDRYEELFAIVGQPHLWYEAIPL